MQAYVQSSFAERFLWYQAARCVRGGIDRQTALESITTVPARMLGLGDRLGAITPGRDATFLLLSADPLSMQSHVEFVFLGGKQVYERAKDFRLRRLLTGEDEKKTPGEKAKDPKKAAKDTDKAKETKTPPAPEASGGKKGAPATPKEKK